MKTFRGFLTLFFLTLYYIALVLFIASEIIFPALFSVRMWELQNQTMKTTSPCTALPPAAPAHETNSSALPQVPHDWTLHGPVGTVCVSGDDRAGHPETGPLRPESPGVGGWSMTP